MNLPPGARIQSDGSVTFPARGKAPDPIEGYISDPADPWRWLKLYELCVHRVIAKPYICTSGRTRTRDFCELLKIPINPAFCGTCTRPHFN